MEQKPKVKEKITNSLIFALRADHGQFRYFVRDSPNSNEI